MQQYLPSKQFTKIILTTIIIGVVAVLIGKIFTKKTVAENKSLENITIGQNEDFFSKDTDSDGLLDWEEALWMTDPNNKDTDGDGINDYDFIKSKKKDIDVDETNNLEQSNQTEVFAKQLFTTTAVLNQSQGFNKDALDQFSQNIDLSLQNFNIKDQYTIADIKTSPVSVISYYENFKSFYESLPENEIPEMSIIAGVITDPEDTIYLEGLSSLITFYSSLRDGLLQISVPYNNVGNHLSFINNANKIEMILKEIVNIDKDPLKTVSYLSKYTEYSDAIDKDLEDLNNYFLNSDI